MNPTFSAVKTAFTLEQLAGKWHVLQTNFPMWLNGNRANPAFLYTVAERNGQAGLTDTVSYLSNGKIKQIKGFDFPQNAENTAFRWRGNGVLGLLKSDWQVIYHNELRDVLLIHFHKTLFTPEGFDVIARQPSLSAADQRQVTAFLTSHDIPPLSSAIRL